MSNSFQVLLLSEPGWDGGLGKKKVQEWDTQKYRLISQCSGISRVQGSPAFSMHHALHDTEAGELSREHGKACISHSSNKVLIGAQASFCKY